jgi:uncharacterized delta-60 repeat protein
MSILRCCSKIFKRTIYPSLPDKTRLVLIFSIVLLGFNASFSQSGILDTSFDPGDGANNSVTSTALQDDGKILIGGAFTSYNGIESNRVARLHEDGSLDTTFAPLTGANDFVRVIIVLNDGKFFIGGRFTSYDGVSRNRVARLNADGSLDTSFDPGTGVNDQISAAVIQDDGKIIIMGFFTFYDGVPRNHIARLNADGSLDTSFDPGTGPNYWGSSISIQNDGKILIGGYFDSYNGIARKHIARLNTNGSLDTSFDPGTGPEDTFESISLQSDGKIIIGGYFNSYNGVAINRIARLNTDGSLDTSFDIGTGLQGYLWTTTVQDDDKILIGGQFISYDGTEIRRIARLNADGSLDLSFDPGTGADDHVASISVQSDGKVIIGGRFTSIDGTARNRIARLNELTTGIDELGEENGKVRIFPNPFSSTTTIQTDFELKNAVLSIFNSSGQSVKQEPNVSGNTIVLSRDNLPGGLYYIRFLQDNQVVATEKLIITD